MPALLDKKKEATNWLKFLQQKKTEVKCASVDKTVLFPLYLPACQVQDRNSAVPRSHSLCLL